MTIRYFPELIQGSEEWLDARRGLLTASEMKHVLTPSLKLANNEKTRSHAYELLAQRISGYVEPSYISDDMLRGMSDELDARMAYAEHVAPVHDMGFITNDRWGFTIGYSPDGLVGEDGAIEVKGRRQKFQVQTIAENIGVDRGETIPEEFMLQIQTGLLVSERKWIDFLSYSGGLPMAVIRVQPMPAVQDAIVEAARAFEAVIRRRHEDYLAALVSGARLIPTERRVEREMYL